MEFYQQMATRPSIFPIQLFLILMVSAFLFCQKSTPQKSNQKAACCPSENSQATQRAVNNTQAVDSALCGISLPSMHEFNTLAKDKNVAFILLPGEDSEKAESVAESINTFVKNKIKESTDVVVFTLQKGAEGYTQISSDFGITTFPGLVVLGRGCQSTAVSGEFTDEKLNQALTLARTPVSGCGPVCTHSH